ncbi:MAG: hypothetical protein HZB38_10985 [Planctomycetes bacterium]|nr:hypothetical protein [Planctomycetota bacterium]
MSNRTLRGLLWASALLAASMQPALAGSETAGVTAGWLRPGAIRADAAVVAFDPAAMAGIRVGDQVDLSLPTAEGDGIPLSLQRFAVTSPDTRFVLNSTQDEFGFDVGQVVLLRGQVAGEPRSHAYLALSPFGCNGFVMQPGMTPLAISSRTRRGLVRR